MTLTLVQLGRGFGPVGTVEAPESVDAPVITAAVVGDDIVVTLTAEAGATNTVWYKLTSASDWSSTSGGAEVTITDPGVGTYQIIAYSTIDGVISPPSNLVSVTVVSDDSHIEEVVYSILTGHEALTSEISSRIYPQIIPQGASLPAIRYTMVSATRQHDVINADDLVQARVQMDCVAESYGVGRELAEIVRGALDNYSGTVGGRDIPVIHLNSESDYYSDVSGVDQLRRYGKTLDFTIWYMENL